MFPHEEYLKKALQECKITALVQDLGNLYVQMVVCATGKDDDEGFRTALKVCNILQKAADEIAQLGPKPNIPHPMDKFSEHLDKATATVRTWPAWKQEVLGGNPGVE